MQFSIFLCFWGRWCSFWGGIFWLGSFWVFPFGRLWSVGTIWWVLPFCWGLFHPFGFLVWDFRRSFCSDFGRFLVFIEPFHLHLGRLLPYWFVVLGGNFRQNGVVFPRNSASVWYFLGAIIFRWDVWHLQILWGGICTTLWVFIGYWLFSAWFLLFQGIYLWIFLYRSFRRVLPEEGHSLR